MDERELPSLDWENIRRRVEAERRARARLRRPGAIVIRIGEPWPPVPERPPSVSVRIEVGGRGE